MTSFVSLSLVWAPLNRVNDVHPHEEGLLALI
jgi:hypothetical protein